MKIQFTNSLTREKEIFTPHDEKHVRIYACGPTVYDRPHLGNARAAVVYDLLFRLLQALYPQVTYARNLTDVDDKIIKAAQENGESIGSLTQRITQYYHDDTAAVGCISPTVEPRATEHIPHMIAMIETLISKGHAYAAEGHVLFAVESFADYGCLARRSVEDMIAGARVEIAPYKKYPGDFVLWKPAKPGEEDASFDSPWGKGRPGWHIECSAMAKEHLGEEFDIHGGGADLMFPHHENEIAQSSCANQRKGFAKYWLHNGFLTVDGEKMSKSLGNFKTVREVLDEGVEGAAIRYLYLTTHYRKPLDYNEKAVQDAAKALDKFRNALHKFANTTAMQDDELLEYLADDLNTPAALAHLHQLASDANGGSDEAAAKLLYGLDLLGLQLDKAVDADKYQQALQLAEARLQAKRNKDWEEADRLRAEITALGFEVRDTKDGFEVV
jgi:cysteinyl-tRNA synthetase